jgi:WS/DGAT/MGAT family acyltransferase
MRQLTGLDTTFLRIESPTTYGHVSGLTLFDPSSRSSQEFTFEDVREHIRERLHLLPPFRWRLAEVPFSLDNPYWVESPEFDLDFHVRELALPAPGDERQLAEQVARLAARPLDRSRPLWELYVIHGIEGGLVGQLTKMHHAAIDGASGAEIMATLLDITPEPRPVPPPPEDWEPDAPPGELSMLGRGIASAATKPLRLLRTAPSTLPSLADVPGMGNLPGVDTISKLSGRLVRRGEGELLERPRQRAPRTSLNGKISPHRRFAFGSVSLDEIKQVKNAFGLTVNDVVMVLCTDALRRWLIDHKELPADPLLAMVPVSVRTGEGEYGNQVSAIVVPLPTNEPDLETRLRLMHDTMTSAKERHKAVPATIMQDFSQFIPPALAARAARTVIGLAASDRVAPSYNVVISNVPGPQLPLYSDGALLVGNYPVSAITDGVGLNMTVMSYNGKVDFGLLACREMMPDIWNLIDYVKESLEEMKEMTGTTPAKTAESA